MAQTPPFDPQSHPCAAPAPVKAVPPPLSNRELQQAILDAHSMLLATGSTHPFLTTLQEHYVQLLAVQRHRAGVIGALKTQEQPE